MSKRDKKPKSELVHTNVLVPSSAATVGVISTIQDRFVDTLNMYLRVRDVELVPPKDLDRDMLLWRTMVVRYKQGDYRHTADEYESAKRVADWVHKIHCELTNQTYVPIEWA